MHEANIIQNLNKYKLYLVGKTVFCNQWFKWEISDLNVLWPTFLQDQFYNSSKYDKKKFVGVYYYTIFTAFIDYL